MTSSKNILSKHNLRFTNPRIQVLQLFLDQNAALSQPDLEEPLKKVCDRVTIYRTLNTFLDKGIIHKVLDEGAMKYALCKSSCHANEVHNHNHVHFKCSQCEKTTCLHDITIHPPTLPAGYQLEETNILVQGICPTCSL